MIGVLNLIWWLAKENFERQSSLWMLGRARCISVGRSSYSASQVARSMAVRGTTHVSNLLLTAIHTTKQFHTSFLLIANLLFSENMDGKQVSGGLFFVDSLPVTPSGKIHRIKVKEMAVAAQKAEKILF